jgi:serine phosphatase RsbU (regulator of sigma subunit)
MWLKLMVEPQYEGKSWEAYSDLEDSFLEMKRKAIDLEAEMEHRVMDLKAEMARITDVFQTTIKELQKSNSRLGSKIEYAESLLGKKAIKII